MDHARKSFQKALGISPSFSIAEGVIYLEKEL